MQLRDELGGRIELLFWQVAGEGRFVRTATPTVVPGKENSSDLINDTFCCFHLATDKVPRPLWMTMTANGSKIDRLISLPPADRVSVAIGQGRGYRHDPQPRVVVAGDIIYAEALLAYLHHGAAMAARLLGPSWVAEQVVGKSWWQAAPSAAAVAGYFSLHWSDHPPRFEQWLEHFAKSTAWFPDSNIIYASYLMKREKADLAKIRDLLIEAWQRGIPIYKEGLRLLSNGLAVLQEDSKVSDPALEQATHQVAQLSIFADPTVSTTIIHRGGSYALLSSLRFDF